MVIPITRETKSIQLAIILDNRLFSANALNVGRMMRLNPRINQAVVVPKPKGIETILNDIAANTSKMKK